MWGRLERGPSSREVGAVGRVGGGAGAWGGGLAATVLPRLCMLPLWGVLMGVGPTGCHSRCGALAPGASVRRICLCRHAVAS